MSAGRAITLIFLTSLHLFAATTAGAAADDRTLYEGDSIYHHITIRQEGGERCMIFGRQRDLRQTCIDLAKPDASIFEYTSMMFAGFLFRPDAKKVCLIGLGGGYIPTVFRMHLPQVRLRTVEVDPLVEKLAKQYFRFAIPSGQTLSIDDGRQFLKKGSDRYDQIWLDAFNSDYIPAHMTTKEFLQLVRSRLNGRNDEGEVLLRQIFHVRVHLDGLEMDLWEVHPEDRGDVAPAEADEADLLRVRPKKEPGEHHRGVFEDGGVRLREVDTGLAEVAPAAEDHAPLPAVLADGNVVIDGIPLVEGLIVRGGLRRRRREKIDTRQKNDADCPACAHATSVFVDRDPARCGPDAPAFLCEPAKYFNGKRGTAPDFSRRNS